MRGVELAWAWNRGVSHTRLLTRLLRITSPSAPVVNGAGQALWLHASQECGSNPITLLTDSGKDRKESWKSPEERQVFRVLSFAVTLACRAGTRTLVPTGTLLLCLPVATYPQQLSFALLDLPMVGEDFSAVSGGFRSCVQLRSFCPPLFLIHHRQNPGLLNSGFVVTPFDLPFFSEQRAVETRCRWCSRAARRKGTGIRQSAPRSRDSLRCPMPW